MARFTCDYKTLPPRGKGTALAVEGACEGYREDEGERFALSLSQPTVASSLSEGAFATITSIKQ